MKNKSLPRDYHIHIELRLPRQHIKYLLEFLYTLKEGNYQYKEEYILTENNSLVQDKKYLSGNGNIHIDKYGNVEFYINYNKIMMMDK